MKILIEMDGDCVDRLSSEVMNGSAVHNLLQQECGRYGGSKAIPQISLLVVCDKDDAEKIYQAGLANAAVMQLIRDN